MATSPTLLSDQDLKIDINGVPHSPRRQLAEDTTDAPNNDELVGYEKTVVQEASPEVRFGPPLSRARERDHLLAGSDNPAECASDLNAVISVAPFNAAPGRRPHLYTTVCLRDQQRTGQHAAANNERGP